jgi:hypothetical protein
MAVANCYVEMTMRGCVALPSPSLKYTDLTTTAVVFVRWLATPD